MSESSSQPKKMYPSCGSNITGEGSQIGVDGATYVHLCSIKTATGWRQQIPLHRRRGPLTQPQARLTIDAREDHDLYEAWLKKHENADALVVDKRSGYVIEAVYDCPVTMDLSEKLDFWANVATFRDEEDDE